MSLQEPRVLIVSRHLPCQSGEYFSDYLYQALPPSRYSSQRVLHIVLRAEAAILNPCRNHTVQAEQNRMGIRRSEILFSNRQSMPEIVSCKAMD